MQAFGLGGNGPDLGNSGVPATFNPGFDSTTTAPTAISPGGTQTVTFTVTTQAAMYQNNPSTQILLHVDAPISTDQVITGLSVQGVTATCDHFGNDLTAPCVQPVGPACTVSLPCNGQAQFALNDPAYQTTYTFTATLFSVTGTGGAPTSPDILITGAPHNETSVLGATGTSVTVSDPELCPTVCSSHLPNMTFSIDQTATWSTLLNHFFSVDYAAQQLPPPPPPPQPSYPSTGAFVIGNGSAVVGNHVYFWGSQWAKNNSLSGGSAPNALKGFESSIQPRTCGGVTWTAQPGNSGQPPATLPSLMIVVVTSTATQSGSAISGDVTQLALVEVDPGYQPDPGHPGTGQVLKLCTPSGGST